MKENEVNQMLADATTAEKIEMANDERMGPEIAEAHQVECSFCMGEGVISNDETGVDDDCEECDGWGVRCPNETACAFCDTYQ